MTAQTELVGRARPLYQRPVLAILLVVVLYLITEIISEFAARSLTGTSYGPRVLVKLGLFAIFAFIVIPQLLRLPRGRLSSTEYLQVIGLRTRVPIHRILILALSCYFLFALSQLLGSLLYYSTHQGSYVFDLSRHSFFETGSIVAAVFEELVFRGVIVTLLLGILPRVRAVVIGAAVFAGLHLLNIFNPEYSTVGVAAQTIWAFGLGLMYAYLFVATRTIVPLIVIHYLINGMVGVWLRGLDGQDVTSALYGIPFFGLLPAGLAVLWGRYLWRCWESVDQARSLR
jgi:membrane protease YdiL (CAAX protease family)